MLINKIQIPRETDAEAFVTFMREEYIPAVHKDPSRAGQVTDLVLLRGHHNTDSGQFFWHVYGDGVYSYPSVDEEAQSKFDSFGARLEFLGNYREVAAWNELYKWSPLKEIFKIQLPKETDVEAFVTFMSEEYFPAVNKGSSRAGQVTNLVLLQGNTTDNTDQFFLHVDGTGVFLVLNVDEEAQSKFKSFGANWRFFGEYRKVTSWHASDTI